MQVRKGHGFNAVEIKRQPGLGGCFVEHLADGVRAIDEQPAAVDPDRQAARVRKGGKRIADAQWDKAVSFMTSSQPCPVCFFR